MRLRYWAIGISFLCFCSLVEGQDWVDLIRVRDGAGQQKEFTETFHRLIEVEQRFGAYTSADLSEETRNRLKEAVKKNIPAAVLDEAKLFVGKEKE